MDGVVAKVKEALPEPKEAKKILPLGVMLFFILFDYTILRDTKVSGGYHTHGDRYVTADQQRTRQTRGLSICCSSCSTHPVFFQLTKAAISV